MLLVADPDRAEGASTHNLEDGQRNGRRERPCIWSTTNARGRKITPRRAHIEAPF